MATATLLQPPNGAAEGKDYYMVWHMVFEVDSKYALIKPIGRGAYGVVSSAVNKETHEKVAIKRIHNVFENSTDALRTLRELKLLRQIKHYNLISLKDIMVPTNRTSFKDIYLVYELMETDLHQIIKSPQPLTNDHCKVCVTRWYRAPELLLCCDHYGTSIDVWSVGCIFADRKPIFPGTECLSQLKLIIDVLGTQHESDLEFIDKPNAKKFLKTMPYTYGTCLSLLYPQADPLAIDLLQKMLVFDPTKRITVTEALQHPYLADLFDPRFTPPTQMWINLDVDENMGVLMIREMMWKEIDHYHPEAASPMLRACRSPCLGVGHEHMLLYS
ncbi:Serine-threonine/tyrosine-protein kinase, catalytic domain [Dillenia turbinata]|uniref:Serine-threonine/tyrosine-protein kinase, catalytic domain n=1 Tax=Dillenia turbinata TaxID=194707 RepID=A0AAN8UVI4_9MAGN